MSDINEVRERLEEMSNDYLPPATGWNRARNDLRALLADHARLQKAMSVPADFDKQDWAGQSGAVAWHLIDRHADNWAEVGEMMEQWRAANSPGQGGAAMTGPIIPADQWPEDAHLHTWDSNGLGNWLRPSYGAWHLWASDIPLPPGHDWRVPVMRPSAEQATNIDLEQFRSLARWVASAEGHRIPSWMRSHADRLLALLDASKNNNLPHVGDINVVVSQPTKGDGVADG